jgi:hypothetical protein
VLRLLKNVILLSIVFCISIYFFQFGHDYFDKNEVTLLSFLLIFFIFLFSSVVAIIGTYICLLPYASFFRKLNQLHVITSFFEYYSFKALFPIFLYFSYILYLSHIDPQANYLLAAAAVYWYIYSCIVTERTTGSFIIHKNFVATAILFTPALYASKLLQGYILQKSTGWSMALVEFFRPMLQFGSNT